MAPATKKDAPEQTPAPVADAPEPIAPVADVPAPVVAMTASERKALSLAQAEEAGPPKDPKEGFNLAQGSEWYPVPGSRNEVGLTLTDQGHYYVTMVGNGRTRSLPLVALTVLENKGLI